MVRPDIRDAQTSVALERDYKPATVQSTDWRSRGVRRSRPEAQPVRAGYRGRYDIDPEFEFLGPGTLLYGKGEITLGRNSYIGRHSRIQSKSGQAVRIGENTAVSYYVHVFTQNRVADQDMSEHLNRNEHLAASRGDVNIGDNCWIGAMTFVTEGCDIDDNTVVGANSVVTRDLPPFCIAAGVPARVRKFKSCLDEDEAAELAEDHRDALTPELRQALCDPESR